MFGRYTRQIAFCNIWSCCSFSDIKSQLILEYNFGFTLKQKYKEVWKMSREHFHLLAGTETQVVLVISSSWVRFTNVDKRTDITQTGIQTLALKTEKINKKTQNKNQLNCKQWTTITNRYLAADQSCAHF